MKSKQTMHLEENKLKKLLEDFTKGNYFMVKDFFTYLEKKYKFGPGKLSADQFTPLMLYELSNISLSPENMNSVKLAYHYFNSEDYKKLMDGSNNALVMLQYVITAMLGALCYRDFLQTDKDALQIMNNIANDIEDDINKDPKTYCQKLMQKIDDNHTISNFFVRAAPHVTNTTNELNKQLEDNTVQGKKRLEANLEEECYQTFNNHLAPYQERRELENYVNAYISHLELHKKHTSSPEKLHQRKEKREALYEMKKLLSDKALVEDVDMSQFEKELSKLENNQTQPSAKHTNFLGIAYQTLKHKINQKKSTEKQLLDAIKGIVEPLKKQVFHKSLWE